MSVKINHRIGAILRPVLAIGMAVLIVTVTTQIITRKLGVSISWGEEIARFTLIWITFIGAVIAMIEKRHIAVDILLAKFPPQFRRIAHMTGQGLILAFLLILTKISWDYMHLQSFQVSPSLRIPMIYVYAIIPAASVVMAVVTLVDMVTLGRKNTL